MIWKIMLRQMKKLVWLMAVLALGSEAWGFSLWGPAETWQIQAVDYGIRYLPYFPMTADTVLDVLGPGDLGGPQNVELGGTKNIGESSRLNTPIITYAYDSTFLSYFGSKGVAAIDGAFKLLNGLPRASSANLAKFLTQGNQQMNYTAQALRMLDLKSTVMWLMMEHMGLIGETHTFDLQYATLTPTPGEFDYVVLQRNFDPVTYNVSDYVNGTLLTYQIGFLPGPGVHDAMEETARAGLPPFSAVATREGLQVGGYYLGITRDDMGGLRYLYRHTHYVNEGLDTNETVSAFASTWVAVQSTNGTTATAPVTGGAVTGGFRGLLGGVEKITFVKTAYDSLLGTFYHPITYHYTIPWVTNGVLTTLGVTRTLTAPDIIFTAGELTFPGPDSYEEALVRNSGFITYGAAVSPGLGVDANIVSPSVITPELVVTLNNSGPIYYNQTFNQDQANAPELGFLWGSFDGTTNAPVLFPTGSSIGQVEAQVLSYTLPTITQSTWQPVGASTNVSGAAGGGAVQ